MSISRGALVAASCILAPAVAVVAAPASLVAQAAPAPGVTQPAGRPARTRGEVRGTVVNAAGQPVTTASITVRPAQGDTALAGTAMVRPDGTFRVDNIRPGRYAVRVRSLGYAPLVRTGIVVTAGGSVDLGRLALANVATQLSAVQVQGQQQAATLAPDRNTFLTKDLPAASGGTAVDVLRNVPQVEVDADNNVSLRGNANVKVQINGRPTPLRGQQLANYLAQLPANLVAKVDVVTNPSAKEDPDGAAGIINITLTQQADLGTSGGVQLSTSTQGLVNPSANIGRQQGPWTGFASYSFFREDRANSGSSDQINTATAVPTSLVSATSGRNQPFFQSATLRGEYKLAARDAVSADAVFNAGTFARRSDASYTAQIGGLISQYAQASAQRSRNLNGDYTLAWRHTVDVEKNALSVQLRLNDSRPDFRSDLVPLPQGTATRTRDTERNPTWRAQVDWTKALGEGTKLETGVLGIRRRSDVDFSTQTYVGGVPLGQAVGGDGFVTDPSQTNAYAYRERVESGYAVLSRRQGPFQLQGGLRLEQATTTFDLATASAGSGVNAGTGAGTAVQQHYDNGYRSVFPSALIAYNLDPKQQFKVSYSRRISRPDPSQLNPFVERQDALSIFQGNPALRPEYTSSYELGYQKSFSAGSFQLNPYYRRTPRAVRFIRTVDTAGITRSTFANVALTSSYGTDVNVNVRSGPLTLFGGGSVFGVSTDAHNVTPDVSFRGTGWSVRGNVTYKLNPMTDAQAFAFYRGPQQTEGGRMNGFTWNSVALKRKLNAENTSTLTLSAQDPFNTIRWGMRTVNGPLVQTTTQRFGARALRLSYSYNFGKPPQLRPQSQEASPQQAPAGGGPPG